MGNPAGSPAAPSRAPTNSTNSVLGCLDVIHLFENDQGAEVHPQRRSNWKRDLAEHFALSPRHRMQAEGEAAHGLSVGPLTHWHVCETLVLHENPMCMLVVEVW
jgi:hypothetical protein